MQVRGKAVGCILAQLRRSIWEKRLTAKHYRQANPASIFKINCGAFSWFRIWLFRALLQQLFLWRLEIQKPKVVVPGMDTMAMDNDEARQRHGVEPTYKKVNGFQPLEHYRRLSWPEGG
jgi:hypothetical protein